ncbi:hypothetical protein DdX_02962 [Ditylenchus destructor]|uniref:Uncharacterized protein n=1 Tax=Ditylenchus destructor TaxID=166010 RepID=A0AAD4NFS1_9BILA|nr:hypothetical protein DdX_02962 [Ditylenchus destructor]
MASGNPENPGFGHGLTSQSQLGSGRVKRQSLRLGETRGLVPVSPTKIDSAGIYGFRKSGKFWIWGVGRGCEQPIASPQLSYYVDDTMQKAHMPYASPILNKTATQEQKVDTTEQRQQNASKPATVPDDNDCKTGAFGTLPKQDEDNQKRTFGGTSNNSVYLPAYHMQPRSN